MWNRDGILSRIFYYFINVNESGEKFVKKTNRINCEVGGAPIAKFTNSNIICANNLIPNTVSCKNRGASGMPLLDCSKTP